MQLSQLLQSQSGAETRTLLEEAPQKNETEQHHGLVEEAGPADLGPDQGHQAGQIGTANPQPHQGVHARRVGARGGDAPAEDRPARPEQGHRGQTGMERKTADQRQFEVSGFADVTQHGQHQQTQGDHQLTPLLPPAQSRGSRWGANTHSQLVRPFPGGKTAAGQRSQNCFHTAF